MYKKNSNHRIKYLEEKRDIAYKPASFDESKLKHKKYSWSHYLSIRNAVEAIIWVLQLEIAHIYI